LMQQAGFQAKDQLLSIDGQAIRTWSDVSLSLITVGIDRRDISVTVANAGGSQLDRTLPLSQVPDSVAEEELINHIGLQSYRVPVPAKMAELDADLPAAKAGLQVDDVITEINGQPVADWYAVVNAISDISTGPITIAYQRDGESFTTTVPALVADPDNPERKVLGIRPAQPSQAERDYYTQLFFKLSYGPLESIPQAFMQMGKITSKSLEMMWKLITGKASIKNLSGPITIAQVANDSAARGFSWYLSFLALVSLSLGIINLVPIPMLDGGQMLFLTIEKFKGSPLSQQFEMKAQLIGMFLLITLMSLAFYNDILRSVA